VSRDLELLRRFADSRDPDALGALYHRHYASLYRVATACVPRHEEAQDAVHGAFLVATRRCHGFRGEGSVRAWLVTILLNRSRDGHRRERPVTDVALLADLRSLAPPVAAPLEREEAEERMLAALRLLPPEQREPLTLHYFEDMTIAEIGQVLGVPRSTVHDRCEKGLGALRRTLGSHARTQAFAGAFAFAGLFPIPAAAKAMTGGVLMAWKVFV
jgi:RNA polymerase sigma-70 factor (ECF subfamily)